MCKEQINKHPKYGNVNSLNRRSNGYFRSETRNHRLKLKFQRRDNKIWTTGVFFDRYKNRLVWFSNLWHRKYWRGVANHIVRHTEDVPDYGSYKKLFYMVLNCDMIHLMGHDIKAPSDSPSKDDDKIAQKRTFAVRTHRLRWTQHRINYTR